MESRLLTIIIPYYGKFLYANSHTITSIRILLMLLMVHLLAMKTMKEKAISMSSLT